MRRLLHILLVLLLPAATRAQTIPWKELKNADELSAKERQVAEATLRAFPCYAGCKGSIATCLAARPRAATAWRLASYVIFLAGMSLDEQEMKEALEKRRESVLPAKVLTIAPDDAPRLGDPRAPVTIVEYADFECPHCAEVSPRLEKVVDRMKGKVSLIFKPYPLRTTGGPLIAARASLAAHRQGKFWPMARLLFERTGSHSAAGVEDLAREAGLDLERFRGAMSDINLLKAIERYKIEGVRLGVVGTPTLFFNGKPYRLPKDEKHLWDRVAEEVELLAASRAQRQ